MAENNSATVYVPQGAADGYAFWGAVGAPMPTVAGGAVGTELTSLGFISSDGLTNKNDLSTDSETDLNGTLIATLFTSRIESYAFSLEQTDIDSLKLSFGEGNVVSDAATKTITVKHSNDVLGKHSFLFRFVLSKSGNTTVIGDLIVPIGQLSALDDITFSAGSTIKYPVTVNALPYEGSATSYWLITTVTTTGADKPEVTPKVTKAMVDKASK